MLEISDLRFGHGMQQMSADKLVLSPGIIGVIGASGSGKSTFLNVISGFHREDQGQIKFEGQDITAFRVEDRPVAMLFQSNNLFPHLSIFRNVALALTSRRWLSNNERLRIEDALSRVDLAGYANRKPGELSGGQQSRAALARVLMQKKPILLLDEPFAALGPALRNEMLDLVQEIAQSENQIVLLVTHAPEDAIRICKETLFISGGKVWSAGETRRALNQIPDEMRDYFG